MIQQICAVCGEKKEFNIREVCKDAECRREHQRIYLKEYRERNKEKVRQWMRESQKRRMERRGPNYCTMCGKKLPNYHMKYCDECKRIKSLEIQKTYYSRHKKEEASRKARWFKENKQLILERRKRRLLSVKTKNGNDTKTLDNGPTY